MPDVFAYRAWTPDADDVVGRDPTQATIASVPIPWISLAVDDIANDNTTPTNIGSASATLTEGAQTLIIAMGCHSTALPGSSHLDLQIGGVTVAIDTSEPPFGNASDVHEALSGQTQLGCAYLYTPGASETMQFRGWCDTSAFRATSCRAYAIDLSDIDEDFGRWHEQTANNDTIVTTPTSGWTTLGTALTFTPLRSGPHTIIVSCEAVADTSGDSFDSIHIRVARGGVPYDGSHNDADIGADLVTNSYSYLFAQTDSFTVGVPATIAVQANGTDSAGNIGYRRIRIHVLEGAQFEEADASMFADSAGGSITGFDTFEADFADGVDPPPAARDYLFLANAQFQGLWYWNAVLTIDSAGANPPDGVAQVPDDVGTGATNDLAHVHLAHIESGITTGVIPGLTFETGPGASGGPYTVNFGDVCAHADAGLITISYFRLQTAGIYEALGVSEIQGTTVSAANGNALMTGAGTLAANDVAEAVDFANLLGSGVLSAQDVAATLDIAALLGSGVLNANDLAPANGFASALGAGTLTANDQAVAVETANLLGTGTLVATDVCTSTVVGNGIGIFFVNAQDVCTTSTIGLVLGTGTLTAQDLGFASENANLVGAGALVGTDIGTSTVIGNGFGIGVLTAQDLSSAGAFALALGAGSLTGIDACSSIETAFVTGEGSLVGYDVAAATCFADSASFSFIEATAIALATCNALLVGTGVLTSTTLAESTTVASLTATGTLTAIDICTATSVAFADQIGVLTATIVGSASCAGFVSASGQLLATDRGTSIETADLRGVGSLSAVTTCTSIETAYYFLDEVLIGVAASFSNCVGTLTGLGTITAVTHCFATETGSMDGLSFISATDVGFSSCTAILYAIIEGVSVAFSTCTATLLGSGTLAGSCIGLSTAVASQTQLDIGRLGMSISAGTQFAAGVNDEQIFNAVVGEIQESATESPGAVQTVTVNEAQRFGLVVGDVD